MGTVAILGGSVVGAAAALQFARSGWQVTVVDAEFDRIADQDGTVEARPGAPHAVQAHGFMARAKVELATRLPDVVDALAAAGVTELPFAKMAPPHLHDGGRPGDDELAMLQSRRVTLDAVLAGILQREPGVHTVRAKATGLELEDGTPPRVTGLGIATGDVVRADLVIDAAGRRSPVTGWLAAAGLPQPEIVDTCNVSYYGRHFRIRAGERPRLNSGFADIHEFPCHLQFMFLGDNETAMMAICVESGDPLLKRVRHEDAYHAVLAANEAFRPWLDLLEPATPTFVLGALNNRMRSLVVDGEPLVLGLHQAGDSLAMTNPTRGRGVAMGLCAVGRLHDLATANGRDDVALATEYAAWQRDVLAVYYQEASTSDQTVGRKLRANILGEAAPANAPAVKLPDGHPVTSAQIEQASASDPDLFRLFLRALYLLDDDRVIASPAVADRVLRRLAEDPDSAAKAPISPVRPWNGSVDRQMLESLLAPYA